MPDELIAAEELWGAWQPKRSSLAAPIGVAADGTVVDIDLHDPVAQHVLLGGGTGTGKSVSLSVLGVGLARHHAPDRLRLLGIDHKGGELEWMQVLPQLERPLGTDSQRTRAVLDYLGHALLQRGELLRAASVDTVADFNAASDRPVVALVLLVDELLDVVLGHADVAADLQQVLREGPRVGIHVIAATQRVSNLRPDFVAAFPTRVVGRTAFVEDSVQLLSTDVATRIEGPGAAVLWALPTGQGRVLRRAYFDPDAGLAGA